MQGITVTLRLPRRLAERLAREASKQGLALEEYILDIVIKEVDPPERARGYLEYLEASLALLHQARLELERGDAGQAAEELWGAAALAVKAYAGWREGRRLASQRELWEYRRVLERELGDWVFDSWAAAQSMHTCFYEGWCGREDVKASLGRVERLVREVASRVTRAPG